jgi:hypothetical protein
LTGFILDLPKLLVGIDAAIGIFEDSVDEGDDVRLPIHAR